MIIKLIKCVVRPGHEDVFLTKQRIWNEAMSREPGFVRVDVARSVENPRETYICIRWESREALDRFMKATHDLLFAQTKMDEHYSHIEVRILEALRG